MKFIKGCLVICLSIIFVSGCDNDINQSIDYILNVKDEKLEKKTITVDYVIDGDTFVSNNEKYRLLLVDTPETVHPNKAVEPYGKEASDYTKKSLEGKEVEIAYDVEKKDKYNRNLVYVYLNNKSFNERLLEIGYAKVTVFEPNTKYVDKYKKIEQKAKTSNKGLWQYNKY